MKKAICHYSYHRTLKAENWTLVDFVKQCAKFGVDGVDFHQRFLPEPAQAPRAISEALKDSGLELSGLSLSTNFNKEGADFDTEVKTAQSWIRAAGEAGAGVSRVFGAHIPDRSKKDELKSALGRVLKAMELIVPAAEDAGVILAIENHGGVPGTGEEQIDVIKRIDSPFLRATIDVGNYMSCGQEGIDGTRIAAPYTAYVHFKDFKKKPEGGLEACTVGAGDVDHAGCLKLMKSAGFNGYVALEYEGTDDEHTGVPASVAFMNEVMKGY